jgi:hypothetical protein
MNRLILTSSLLFVACAATDPTDDGEPTNGNESLLCEPVSSVVLGADEVSPLGFSARAALDAASGEHTAPLVWADGAQSQLTTDVAQAGDVVYVDYEVVDDGSGMEPAIGCVDQVEVPVALVVTSADGAFGETRNVQLVVDADGASASLDLAGPLQGSFDVNAFVPDGAAYDEVSASLSLSWSAGGLSGSVDGQGSGTDGDVAFAEGFFIATIGASAE